MSAQANIVAFDGAATPVSHTFTPVSSSIDPKTGENVALWREINAALPVQAQATVRMSALLQKNGVYRMVVSVQVPVMESVSGQNAAGYTAAPAVAYVNTVTAIGYFNKRSSVTDHRIVRKLCENIMQNVSTSVAVATTGPAPELLDSFIVAS